jgi:hypothetical protein
MQTALSGMQDIQQKFNLVSGEILEQQQVIVRF